VNLQDAISEFNAAVLARSYPPHRSLNAVQECCERMPDEVQAAVHQMTRVAFPKSGVPQLYSQAVYRLRVARAGRLGLGR